MTGPVAWGEGGRLRSRPSRASAPPAPGPDAGPWPEALDAIGLPFTLLLAPARPAAPSPLLVWFHGAGGSAALAVPAVQGPVATHGAAALVPSSVGATWDLLQGGLGPDTGPLDRALAHVFATLDVSRVAFGGFSDGASYALSLGLANGDLVEAVLAFSPGFCAPPRRVGRPRCWVVHGTADEVLPVDRCGRRVVEQLQGQGHDVAYEEFDGAHVLPGELLQRSVAWWLDGGSG